MSKSMKEINIFALTLTHILNNAYFRGVDEIVFSSFESGNCQIDFLGSRTDGNECNNTIHPISDSDYKILQNGLSDDSICLELVAEERTAKLLRFWSVEPSANGLDMTLNGIAWDFLLVSEDIGDNDPVMLRILNRQASNKTSDRFEISDYDIDGMLGRLNISAYI